MDSFAAAPAAAAATANGEVRALGSGSCEGEFMGDDYDDDNWAGHMLRLSMAFSCMTHNDDFVLFSRPSKLGQFCNVPVYLGISGKTTTYNV
jgi:hypothetical protein